MKSSIQLRVQRIFAVLFILTNVSLIACAQSPKKSAEGKIGEATVSIQYSSPSVKGRTIWGELVPYDKVWRAGANAATIFTTDKDLKVEGKKLPAGSYSLFAIPGKSSWTIIFNSQTGQPGTKQGGEANLDRANDVLNVTVKPVSNAMTEAMTYEIDSKGIALVWEKLKVPVKIK